MTNDELWQAEINNLKAQVLSLVETMRENKKCYDRAMVVAEKWRAATQAMKRGEDYQETHKLRVRGQMVATNAGMLCPVCGDTKSYTERYALLGDYVPVNDY